MVEKNSLADWIINTVKSKKEVLAFDDYYVSSIDTLSFTKFLFNLIDKDATGIFNLASSEVFSKKELITCFAKNLKIPIKIKVSSAKTLKLKGA